MKISWLSNLEFEVDTVNEQERFYNPDTGFEAIWNTGTTTDEYGLYPHTGLVTSIGNWTDVQVTPALNFEGQFVPVDTVVDPLQASELTDRVKNSHQTGPENRRYIAPHLKPIFYGNQTQKDKAVKGLIDYNLCQLNRPFSHQWIKAPQENLFINKGTPYEWNLDKSTPSGWNMFDVAHNETAPEFALAALGHDLGLMNMWMLWRYFIAALNPNTEFWRNQPRAEAWTLILAVRCHYLGFNKADQTLLDTYCRGWVPRKALEGYVDKILASGVDPQVSGPPDSRVFAVLPDKDWHGYGKQCQGGYVWQPAVRHWSYAYVLQSGILDSMRQEALRAHAQADILKYKEWAYDAARGMSWCLNRTEMPPADAQALYDDIMAGPGPAGSRPYEVRQLSNGNALVVEQPTTQDLALHAGAWCYIMGKDYEPFVNLFSRIPKPGNSKYEAKYMDAVWAYLERN